MIVRQTGERTQIAVLEDDVLVEHYVARAADAGKEVAQGDGSPFDVEHVQTLPDHLLTGGAQGRGAHLSFDDVAVRGTDSEDEFRHLTLSLASTWTSGPPERYAPCNRAQGRGDSGHGSISQ